MAVAKDLPNGGAQPVRLLGEDFTLYRGETGTPHLVGARCPHRGTFLHTGWVEDDCVRCFYHGWKFDPSGACVEQPFEQAGFAAASRIASHHVQEYAGLVFVYIGEGDPPPLPRYPELEQPGFEVDRQHPPAGRVAGQLLPDAREQRRPRAPHLRAPGDAAVRPHAAGAQRRAGRRRRRPHRAARGQAAALHALLVPDADPAAVGADPGPATPTARSSTGRRRSTTSTRCSSPPRAVPAGLLDEIEDPEEMGGRTMPADAGPQLLAGARRPESVTEEDYVAMVGQGTIADRVNERLGRSDIGIVELRRLWSEQLAPLVTSS